MSSVSVVEALDPERVLPLAAAKQHLRIGYDVEDEYIRGLVQVAIATLDGPDGWLGRALGEQVLELRCCGFPTDCGWGAGIYLPCEPVGSIVSISFVDLAGAAQMLDPSAYRLTGGSAWPSFGSRWPAVRQEPDGVVIRYGAGYQATPAPIVHALKLMVGDMFAQRSTIAIGTVSKAPMSVTVEALLSPYRIWQSC